MAGGAHVVRPSVRCGERRVLAVVEGRIQPIGRVMAVLASRREKLRLCGVARVRGIVVIGPVTTDTGRGQRRVVAIDVAIGALPRWRRVRSGQGERSVVVVEHGIGPGRCIVAHIAGVWKTN